MIEEKAHPAATGHKSAGKKKLSDNYYHQSTGGVQPLLYSDFIDAGYRIFGLHRIDNEGCGCGDPRCSAAGKHPVAANWQHTPIWSDEQIEAMEMSGQLDTGYGVLVAHGLLVVDVDARNGGVESYQRLVDAVPEIAGAGLIVETGSGGGSKHLYFTVPSDAALRQHLDDYKGIDFKSSGFVVGPGSLHASGRRYEVLVGSVADIAPAPQALIDLLRKPDRVRASVGGAAVDYTIAELRDMVMSIPNDGDAGHEVYIRVGMALHEATGGSGDGFNVWIDWAKQSPRYSKAGRSRIESRWHSFGKATNPVTIGTLVHYAEQAGWRMPVTFEDHTEWHQTGEKKSSADTASEWQPPEPLVDAGEAEIYPLAALPGRVLAAVTEVVGFVKAPIPLVAGCALSALALAIQAHYDVRRADRLEGPTGLFMLTIADSGERKSTVDGFFTRAIADYEREQREAAKPLLKEYRAAAASWEARFSGVKEAIKNAARNGKDSSIMEAELLQLEKEKPEPPKIPRLIYVDVTPESLAHNLAKQWPVGGVVSAEAGLVLGSHSMSADSAMRNMALLNQLWDAKPLTIDRRTSESFTVEAARLSVSLQVQEQTLREFLDKAGSLARGTGFLARFLIAWPESTQGLRPFTEAPANWPALAAFNRRLSAILNEPAPTNDEGVLEPSMMTLESDAKALWIQFHDAIESELSVGGELADIRDAAAKAADNAARLAALFQAFESGGTTISADMFDRASRIVAWHLSESRRFFGEMAQPKELLDVVKLDDWVVRYCRSHGVGSVSKRHLLQYGPNGTRDSARLSKALNAMAAHGRARCQQQGRKIEVLVNPLLLGGVL